MKFIDLFAGLGGFHLALTDQGHKCVYSCEIEESLRDLYKKNFNIYPDGDITKIDVKKIPNHDILCAGFPCQPFSKAGNSQGFNHKVAGQMFFYLLKIIKDHNPKFIFLENVPNLLAHNNGKTWDFMKKKLMKLGYDVDQKIISPIDFNVPQTRDRLYIVGKQNKLNGFIWPKKLKPKNNLKNYLSKNPINIRKISDQKENTINTWKYFLSKIPKKNYLPNPLWSMEFGATYSYTEITPYSMKLKDLQKLKGKYGISLSGMSREEIFENIPNYAKNKTKHFPDWKIRMIRRTREFYKINKKWVDKFLYKIIDLKYEAHQKLEWNCQGDKFNLTKKIISFRSSGVRIRRNHSSPTLISSSTTQVPYLAWKKRYLSIDECMKIQGFEKLKHFPTEVDKFYPAIGNAVNVKVVSKIAKNLFN
jgi:DNA (cytosine-5)-methyltransferase 1